MGRSYCEEICWWVFEFFDLEDFGFMYGGVFVVVLMVCGYWYGCVKDFVGYGDVWFEVLYWSDLWVGVGVGVGGIVVDFVCFVEVFFVGEFFFVVVFEIFCGDGDYGFQCM